ncbi:MFS transporter [Asanoa sp. NPDC049573]|uniref:MFS transporter n=1 Tax=Asanoa sp. NPDC049573 TaxID=3155396 RepID=UPI003421A172
MNSTMEGGRKLAAWTLVLASLGSFLASLDVVVVATALPALRSGLGADLADLEWTVNAYNLVCACLMLTGAALGDRFGRRRTFVLGVLVFGAASTAAALAGDATTLILARAVQGAGAAIVLPLSLTLISDAFPAERRSVAIGIWGGVSGLGVAAGPVVGGAVVQGISWHWIFWLNVPVALAVAALSAVRLRESHGPRPHLDLPGVLLGGAGLLALVWAPVRAPVVGWTSAEVLGALVAGVLLMVAFVRWERRAAYPMLPLRYFRSRAFSAANAVIFIQFISLIGSLFIITQLFQIGLGYRPLEAGLRLLVWMAMPMLVAPVGGVLAGRFGNRPVMLVGMVLQGAGLGWLAAEVRPGVGYGLLVAPLIVAGVGISLVFPTSADAVVAAVPPQDAGVAAGTNTSLREIGGVFGVAVLAAVFAAHGGYADFLHGVRAALVVAAVAPALGVVAAYLVPARAPAPERQAEPLYAG